MRVTRSAILTIPSSLTSMLSRSVSHWSLVRASAPLSPLSKCLGHIITLWTYEDDLTWCDSWTRSPLRPHQTLRRPRTTNKWIWNWSDQSIENMTYCMPHRLGTGFDFCRFWQPPGTAQRWCLVHWTAWSGLRSKLHLIVTSVSWCLCYLRLKRILSQTSDCVTNARLGQKPRAVTKVTENLL